ECFKHKAVKRNSRLRNLHNKKSTFKMRKVPSFIDEIHCENCHAFKKNSLDLELSFLNYTLNISEEEITNAPTIGQGAFGVVKKITITNNNNNNNEETIAIKVFSDLE